ncbi:MAG: hypothetical protein J7501_10230 [Bdellovibrio sp.]|nr:hypothetical protein [Bdellovibrio sp.]
MKLLAFILSASFLTSAAFAADSKIEGISGSNAAIITEALLEASKTNSEITVDASTYTVTRVSSVDATGTSVECARFAFGGTPARYECRIQTAQ